MIQSEEAEEKVEYNNAEKISKECPLNKLVLTFQGGPAHLDHPGLRKIQFIFYFSEAHPLKKKVTIFVPGVPRHSWLMAP